MSANVRVKLLRPLDGREAGSEHEYPELDAKRLEGFGAVEILREKAAPEPQNKMAPTPQNKAAAPRGKKGR